MKGDDLKQYDEWKTASSESTKWLYAKEALVADEKLLKGDEGVPHCPKVKGSTWKDNANWANPRNCEQYVQDYSDRAAAENNRSATGHMFNSISKNPLIPAPERI